MATKTILLQKKLTDNISLTTSVDIDESVITAEKVTALNSVASQLTSLANEVRQMENQLLTTAEDAIKGIISASPPR